MDEVFYPDKKISAAKWNLSGITNIFLIIALVVWVAIAAVFLILDFEKNICFVALFTLFIFAIGATILFSGSAKSNLKYVLKEKSIVIFEESGSSEYQYKQFKSLSVLPFKKAIREYHWNARYFGKVLDFTGMSIHQSPSLEPIKNANIGLIEQYEKTGLVNFGGDVVLVMLKGSPFEVMLLKPDDIEGFVKSIRKKMNAGRY